MGPLNDNIWSSVACTDAGKVRDHNEDAYLDLPAQSLWVVADGMGGHSEGEVASRMIVDSLRQYRRTTQLGANVRQITQRLRAVNSALLHRAGPGSSRIIGSTVAVFLADHHHGVCLWAGDSRVYRYRDKTLKQLTLDHNHAENLMEDGMPAEQIVLHPGAQALTRAVGSEDTLDLESRILELKQGDIYLLCSDGLTKEVTDREIADILAASHSLFQSMHTLKDLALQRAGRDNVTILLTQFN